MTVPSIGEKNVIKDQQQLKQYSEKYTEQFYFSYKL